MRFLPFTSEHASMQRLGVALICCTGGNKKGHAAERLSRCMLPLWVEKAGTSGPAADYEPMTMHTSRWKRDG